jgi:hypothetical protein
MLMSRNRTFLFAAFACGALLTACDDAPPAPAASGTPTRKSVPKVAGLPPEMVAAVSPGRNSTVVSVHFALRDTPAVSQALPVDIAIVPHQEFTSLRAHFEGYDGIALTTGENLEPVAGAALEKPIKHQLILLPAREGVFIVTASVETEGIDGNVTRIFSIPVIVAPVSPPPAAPNPPASPPSP